MKLNLKNLVIALAMLAVGAHGSIGVVGDTTSQLRRRLSGASDLAAAAERACAQWGVGKKACIYDVLSTGDLEMAESGY
jgi:hypothetical protein